MGTANLTRPFFLGLLVAVGAHFLPVRAAALSLGVCVGFQFDVEVLGPPAGSASASGCGSQIPVEGARVRFGPATDPSHGTDPILYARASGNSDVLFNDVTVGVQTIIRGYTLAPADNIRLHAEGTRDFTVDDATLPLRFGGLPPVPEAWNTFDYSIHVVGPDGFDLLFENAYPPRVVPISAEGVYRVTVDIDATTNQSVPLGNGQISLTVVQLPVIPEPSTGLLVAVGLAGLRLARGCNRRGADRALPAAARPGAERLALS